MTVSGTAALSDSVGQTTLPLRASSSTCCIQVAVRQKLEQIATQRLQEGQVALFGDMLDKETTSTSIPRTDMRLQAFKSRKLHCRAAKSFQHNRQWLLYQST